MITLIDGYGQLGEALKKNIPEVTEDIVIYHKWNIDDKSEEAQKKCFDEFWQFRKAYSGKVIFISTKSENESPYTKWKKAAEAVCSDEDAIVRLPILIGKGPCLDLYNQGKPFGEMELQAIDEVVSCIILCISITGLHEMSGYTVPAYIVKELIQFGKNGI